MPGSMTPSEVKSECDKLEVSPSAHAASSTPQKSHGNTAGGGESTSALKMPKKGKKNR